MAGRALLVGSALALVGLACSPPAQGAAAAGRTFATCSRGALASLRPASCARRRARAPRTSSPLLADSVADDAVITEPSWTRALTPASAPDPYKVAKRVLPIILVHGLWATCVVIIHIATDFRLRAPSLLHTLLGGVLGLLLAFRTNQAYERYWSSCKLWTQLHAAAHNMARLASHLSDSKVNDYTSILRHLIAYPIALKQHLRRERDDKEFWPILWLSEIDAMMNARSPHMVLLASLSMLIRPVKQRDDGSGKDLAIWSQLEGCVTQLQTIACSLEQVVKLPPPQSYSLLTARFVFLWVGTLPLVLVGFMRPYLVPPSMLLVAWALYSTEELAQLMEAPFGNALQPETVPMDMYCAHIVTELQQQAFVQRAIDRRIAERTWVIKPEDLIAYSAVESSEHDDADESVTDVS